MSIVEDGDGSASQSDQPDERPPWRRILYAAQPYPDTYLPSDTYAPPIKQVDEPSHLSIITALSPLTQNINVFVVFLGLFHRLEQGQIQAAPLILACLAALLVCSLLGLATTWRRSTSKDHGNISSSVTTSPSSIVSFAVLLLLLYALSPVLKTLTEATTSDTIYPLSLMLFALHICLADNILRPEGVIHRDSIDSSQDTTKSARRSAKARGPPPPPQLFSALSLNAATAASLVLASRLPSNAHVFALLFTSILAFALFPIYSRRTCGILLRLAISLVLILLAISSTAFVSSTLAVLVAIVNGFVLLVVPAWMKASKRGKVRYDGPWKVAKPQLSRKRRYSVF